MSDMSPQEIKSLYEDLQCYTDYDIECFILTELSPSFICAEPGLESEEEVISPKYDYSEVRNICINQLESAKRKIAGMKNTNPNGTNITLEIIQLVAPTVAQLCVGLSGFIIVGTLVIIIKHHIVNL